MNEYRCYKLNNNAANVMSGWRTNVERPAKHAIQKRRSKSDE